MIKKNIVINKIYNECCLDTMLSMDDNYVDLIITSPPYDNMRKYSGNTFNQFEKIAQELYRIIAIGGVVVWIVGDQTIKSNETGTSFRQALYFKEVGFNLFDTMIYQKKPRGAVGNNKGYWQTFEYMFILSKGTPKTINLLMDRKNKGARDGDTSKKRMFDGTMQTVKRKGYAKMGRRTNIWEYLTGKGHSASDKIAYSHPAIFPEKLVKDHILSWSNKENLVYDPFMGSGTVAKCCELLNRKWIGSEICKEYCGIAKERIRGVRNDSL